MKRSLIWTTAGIAAIGFAAPALAARGDAPRPVLPASVTVTVPTSTNAPANSIDATIVTTANSAKDVSGPCDEAEHVNDPRCTSDNVETIGSTTANSTANSVEDVSGPCDEAEHVNDPRCTGVVADSADDSGGGSSDDSGGGSSDDSGHGSSDDSGHGSSDDN